MILVFLGDTPKSTYRTCAHHIRTRERRRGSRPAVALNVCGDRWKTRCRPSTCGVLACMGASVLSSTERDQRPGSSVKERKKERSELENSVDGRHHPPQMKAHIDRTELEQVQAPQTAL